MHGVPNFLRIFRRENLLLNENTPGGKVFFRQKWKILVEQDGAWYS